MAEVVSRGGYFSRRRNAVSNTASEAKPEFEVVDKNDFEHLKNKKVEDVYMSESDMIVSYQSDLGMNAWKAIASDTDDIPSMTYRICLTGVPTNPKTGDSVFAQYDPTMTYTVTVRSAGAPICGRIKRTHEDHLKGRKDVLTYSASMVFVKAVSRDGAITILGQPDAVKRYEEHLKATEKPDGDKKPAKGDKSK